MEDKKTLFILIGAYPDIGKGTLTASIAYLLNKYAIKTSIVKFDGYFNIDSGNMNPYDKLPDLSYSEEEVFVLKDGYQADADHGYYERFIDEELTGDSCMTNGSLLNELLDKIKKGAYKSGEILKYKTLRNLIKQKIYTLMANNKALILEVGGTIGDEEALQLYKTLNEIKDEGIIETKVIMISPYLSNKHTTESIELSSRTKMTRKAFQEASSFGLRPDFIFLRNSVEILKNDLEYISQDCNLSEKNIFLDPQFSNIYKLPESIEMQGFLENFTKAEKIVGRLEVYNKAKEKLIDAPELKIGIFGKTMSYDSYVSIKEAIEHASVENSINVKISWVDDFLIRNEEVPLIEFDGIIIGEGKYYLKERLALIKYARKMNIPLLAISFGADLLVKEYCQDVLGFEVDLEGLDNHKKSLYLGSKKTRLSTDSIVSQIYESDEVSERYRIYDWIPQNIIEKFDKSIMVTGFTPENYPSVFEIKGESFCLGVQFHPEFKSRPGKPSPLFTEFLKKSLLSKKNLTLKQFKILIVEKIK